MVIIKQRITRGMRGKISSFFFVLGKIYKTLFSQAYVIPVSCGAEAQVVGPITTRGNEIIKINLLVLVTRKNVALSFATQHAKRGTKMSYWEQSVLTLRSQDLFAYYAMYV